MEGLPFELLEHLAYCVSLEPLPQLRQTSLSYLSRTNKTLQLAAQPILYRDPTFLSDWRARIYEKTLSKNVTPWLLSRSSEVEKPWWMPRSLKFDFAKPPRECYEIMYPSASSVDFEFDSAGGCDVPSFVACRHDFIWSCLTSFGTSAHALDTNFSPHLFGPVKRARNVVKSLIIHGEAFAEYYPFLFDAVHFINPCQFLAEEVKNGTDWPSDHDDADLEAWERPRGGQRDPEAWEWEDAGPKLLEKARYDYDVWGKHLDLDALYSLDFDSLSRSIHSQPPSPFPFSALTTLRIRCDTPLDYFLIFYTSSFPRLQNLSLTSESGFGTGDEMEWATLRFSITREKGVGINHDAEEDDASILKPLSENEMLEYPLKPYQGPNLRSLGLYYPN
ncbi:uncharacterized protein JCM6883_001311 [Sporobolomyces salmoneus]|uniref:uncharacterized protein n=1 Tax=Sporobolomyces salmoneus TaxID=183962 RepID=UPI00317D6E06